MADRLNWMPSYVSAIEENRFDELRGAAFVRGYLRAYAKQVALPEDELMAAYAAHCSEHSPTEETDKRVESRVPQVHKKGIAIPAGTAIVVLVVFLLWYWRGEEPPASGTPVPAGAEFSEVDAPQQAEALVQEQSISLLVVPESESGKAGEDVAAPMNEMTNETMNESQAAVEEAELAAAAVAAAGDTENAAVPEQLALEPDSGAVGSGPNIITVDTVGSTPGAETGQLQFRFSGDCWLEVRTAAEELIYADLRRAGDVLNLSGEAPFKLLLGDARAVEIDYQGEPVTIRRRPGRSVATFTVGEQ
jgi:cytoskeleton protein RodZ